MTKVKTAKKQEKIVALVGSASSSCNLAPWDNKDIEIWTLAWREVKRAERYFDMHSLNPNHRSKRSLPGPEYLNRMSVLPGIVYLQEEHPEIPNSQKYPFDEVVEFLDSVDPYANGVYFASSVAFMIGLALYEGYSEIQIYGIDLLANDEYAHQRPNAEYLIGLARGRGVKVLIPDTSAMCKFPYIYGYDDEMLVETLSIELIEKHLRDYNQQKETALITLHTCDGAIQECQQLLGYLRSAKRGHQIKGAENG
ncbi:hypothetical protein CL634_07310 [bacterium]|nr:hypothetical protein [bacterium]